MKSKIFFYIFVTFLILDRSNSYAMLRQGIVRRSGTQAIPRIAPVISPVSSFSTDIAPASNNNQEYKFRQAVEKWQESVPQRYQKLAKYVAEQLKIIPYRLPSDDASIKIGPKDWYDDFDKVKDIFRELLPYDISAMNIHLFKHGSIDQQKEALETVRDLQPEYLALQHMINSIAPVGRRPFISKPEKWQRQNLAHYIPDAEHIELADFWEEMPPSSQLTTIYHEYRHHLQKLAEESAISNFYPKKVRDVAAENQNNAIWDINEQDADYFAAQHCTCPICLKVIQAVRGNRESSRRKGYFGDKDYNSFIEEAEHNACCPAHTLTPGDHEHNVIVEELEANLKKLATVSEDNSPKEYSKLCNNIIELDKKSGTLLQHIPKYQENLLQSFIEHQQFWQGLALRTAKNIENRQKEEYESGLVKFLPAPKESTMADQEERLRKEKLKKTAEAEQKTLKRNAKKSFESGL